MTTTETTTAPARTIEATRTLSIIALIAGIASVALGQTFFLPIAAIVFGVLGYQREPAGRAYAIWGIALAAVALFGWAILTVVGFVFAAPWIAFGLL